LEGDDGEESGPGAPHGDAASAARTSFLQALHSPFDKEIFLLAIPALFRCVQHTRIQPLHRFGGGCMGCAQPRASQPLPSIPLPLCSVLLDPVMGMVSTAIVGSRLGTASLAAVGLCTIVYNFSK
jgi:hypothetical protein